MSSKSSEQSKVSPWREKWVGKVCTPDDMVAFVDDVGCCTSGPLPGYPDFPTQSEVFGEIDPNVPVTWFWKDDLHVQKRLYYTRVFGGQPGFVSLSLLPALVATNGAVADELLYEGKLSPEAQQIYRVIEAQGPIPIRKLKSELTPDAKKSCSRIINELERQFLISKTEITGRTLGTYGYVWDLMERWMPEVLEEADSMGRDKSKVIVRNHLASFGITTESPFYRKVLGWTD